jgi:hypothetical protein
MEPGEYSYACCSVSGLLEIEGNIRGLLMLSPVAGVFCNKVEKQSGRDTLIGKGCIGFGLSLGLRFVCR